MRTGLCLSPCFLEVELFCLFSLLGSCFIHSVGAVISAMTERQSDDDLHSVYTAKLYLTSSVRSCQPVASCFQHSHSQAVTTKPRRENFIQSPRSSSFFFPKISNLSFVFFWQLEISIWCNGAFLRNYILIFNINSLTRCSFTEQSEDQELKATQK